MENSSKSDDNTKTTNITLLSKVPPKRGSIPIKPSSSRFEIDSSKHTTPIPLKVVISKPETKQETKPVIKLVTKQDTTPVTNPVTKQEPKLVIKQETKSFSAIVPAKPMVSIHSDDPCTQYNFFMFDEMSCFIDSLLFGLLHKLENNFIIDLMETRKLPDTSRENCRNNAIDAIVGLHHYIHDNSQPVKRTMCSEFRELLYKCDTQRETDFIPKSVYTSTQQDPHDFIGKILNIINLPQSNYNETKIYSRPIGDPVLISEFQEYTTNRDINTNHSLLIYTETATSKVIDIGFTQIDDNTFAFDTPEETIEFEKANGEYPDIIEYIYKNNMIAENVKRNIREHDPDLSEFFNPEIEQKKKISLYQDIYNAHIMLFSQESHRMEKHYKYRGDLPKLTYTRSAISKIYSNPINFFVISIARENNDGTKNELELVNLPECIKISGKTLQLVSAIVHFGQKLLEGHYVCYFKCGNHWYIMNNVRDNITQHARFDIKNREIMSKCRLLIYM